MCGKECQMVGEQCRPAVGRLFVGLLLGIACASASAQVWNLESSVERATTVAPELRAAEAEVAARAGEPTQGGARAAAARPRAPAGFPAAPTRRGQPSARRGTPAAR